VSFDIFVLQLLEFHSHVFHKQDLPNGAVLFLTVSVEKIM